MSWSWFILILISIEVIGWIVIVCWVACWGLYDDWKQQQKK